MFHESRFFLFNFDVDLCFGKICPTEAYWI